MSHGHYCRDCKHREGTLCRKRDKTYSKGTMLYAKNFCAHWEKAEVKYYAAKERKHGLVDSSCKGCQYLGSMQGGGGGYGAPCCDYILIMKKPRPCPAGRECTEYVGKAPTGRHRHAE